MKKTWKKIWIIYWEKIIMRKNSEKKLKACSLTLIKIEEIKLDLLTIEYNTTERTKLVIWFETLHTYRNWNLTHLSELYPFVWIYCTFIDLFPQFSDYIIYFFPCRDMWCQKQQLAAWTFFSSANAGVFLKYRKKFNFNNINNFSFLLRKWKKFIF